MAQTVINTSKTFCFLIITQEKGGAISSQEVSITTRRGVAEAKRTAIIKSGMKNIVGCTLQSVKEFMD